MRSSRAIHRRYLSRILALGAVLAISLAMGCGGGDGGDEAAPPAATQQSRPVAVSPTPVPVSPVAVSPTPVPASPAAETVSFDVENCAAVREAAGGDGQAPVAAFAICRAQHIRQLFDGYIEALNSYDLSVVLPQLIEGYRATQESALRAQIDELKAANAQLTWTEDQLPGLTGPTSMALLVTVNGPTGNSRWQVLFTELGKRGDGGWVISSVEVTEDSD